MTASRLAESISINLLEYSDLNAWVLHVLDVYDRQGTQGCIAAMRNVHEYAAEIEAQKNGYGFAEVEPEALVLLCESLERLGDRYAIYGFSGYTRMRCEVFRVKDFSDPYNAQAKARICGIRPQDHTRMGAVIRHLSGKLLAVDAGARLLIALADGRPNDEDGYRGDYGIEDTRRPSSRRASEASILSASPSMMRLRIIFRICLERLLIRSSRKSRSCRIRFRTSIGVSPFDR